MPALSGISVADRSKSGGSRLIRKDTASADRTIQNPRRLLRRRRTGGGFHVERDDGNDPVTPSDALTDPLRTNIPRGIPDVLWRTVALEPVRAATELPAPPRLIAGLHGRPLDKRMRLGRLLFRQLRPSAARHGHRPETENPAGSELCTMGPCRKICTETTPTR